MLDKKTFVIGILSLMAAVLIAANILAPRGAIAANTAVTDDKNYTMDTARAVAGGDSLYITDNNSGMMVVFTYNPATKSLAFGDKRLVQAAFAGIAKKGR